MTGVQVAVGQARGSLRAGVCIAMANAVRKSLQEFPNVLTSMSQAFDQRLLPRGQVKEANLRIARAAQSAMVSGYESRLPRGGGVGELSGTLGPALASPAMTSGTTDRVIAFLNTDALNQQAKHWYRINYGAIGPNLHAPGGHEARAFTVNVNGRPFVTLRDPGKPAATSWLPANFYWADNNWFIATRGPARPSGAGARAAHFVDLGLEAIAHEFPIQYELLMRDFLKDSKNRAKLERKGIKVIADIRLESYGYNVTVR